MSYEKGICNCGCGGTTGTATRRRNGYEKGEPLLFIRGHIGRLNSLKGFAAKLSVSADGASLKRCTACNESKPEAEFNKSRTRLEYRRSHCKTCERKAAKAHWAKNPEPYRRRAKVRTKQTVEKRRALLRVLREKGCRVCPEKEPCVMDFHHLNARKDYGGKLATYLRSSDKQFADEIAKCVVLCASCHRKAHAGVIKIDSSMLCERPIMNKNDGKIHLA